MKISIGASTLALALLLAGCGGGDGANNAAAAPSGPLTNIAAPNNGDWTEVISETPEGGIRMGNPDAPVKLIEYASMTCPHCATFSAEASESLRGQYVRSGQVSLEFRNFVMNGADAAASLLARCMPTPAFFRITEQLFAEQEQWLADLDQADQERIMAMPQGEQIAGFARATGLPTFFRNRGMPEGRFNQCIADPQAAQRLAERTRHAAEQVGVTGTPTFLINGELVRGNTWQQIEPLVRQRIGG